MITISLTKFIDFVAKAGSSKMTIVKQIKYSEEYQPALDFWKTLREGIVEKHEQNKDKKFLDRISGSLTDQKKIKIYPDRIKQYKSWLGRKTTEWFQPPYKECTFGDLKIHLNPELGLIVNGEPMVIKLYFKAEPLSKAKADIILVLMTKYLDDSPVEGRKYCVLDVAQKKLFIFRW